MAIMVWYLTPEQVLIHHRVSKKANKKQDNDDNNSRENPNYDFSIDKGNIILQINLIKFYVPYAREVTRY
jgi:hypothetical protein